MSQEEREPVKASVTVTNLDGAPTTSPAAAAATAVANTVAANGGIACPVCKAGPREPCTNDCTLKADMDAKVAAHVAGIKDTSSKHIPSVAKPRVKAGDYIKNQRAGDTGGFPKISQDELLKLPSVQLLLEMLTYMRPAGSETETKYIEKFIVPHGSKKDKFGNRWVWINHPDGKASDILFSSHTDTVHRAHGIQQVTVGDGRAWTEVGSCLGADDTVGNWLMIEMIKAKVPGCYVFHREEECGGNGSGWIKKHKGGTLQKMRAAIAFDRKDYHSVITHQGGVRCCSEAFSASLSAILGGSFKSDTGGTFTDTKNYIGDIAECTNLSVGYHAQHGPTEWQELSFAVGLRDALIHADWSKLVIERKPGTMVYDSYGDGHAYGGYFGQSYTPKYQRNQVSQRESREDAAFDDWQQIDGKWHHTDDLEWSPALKEWTLKRDEAVKTGKPTAMSDAQKAWQRHNKRKANMYGEYAAKEAEQKLLDLLDYTTMYPETIAHFLAEKGIMAEDIGQWFSECTIPGRMTWDDDDDVT